MKFNVGQTYSSRFITDSDSVAHFTILARTDKTVKTKVYSDIVTRRVSVYNGVEQFKPFGSYSMCMIIGADDRDLRAAGQ